MGITYTVLTPFLSPIIFSLRNKELKTTMKKTLLSKLSRKFIISYESLN
jgi:olfactory receptor